MTSDVLIVAPPAAGLINHSIALALRLQTSGHSPLLVTGSESAAHLKRMDSPVKCRLLDSHQVSFDYRNAKRKSHLEQVTSPRYLQHAADELMRLMEDEQPRWIIAKNSPHVPLVSAQTGVPWASYLTGGPVHLDPVRGPIYRNINFEQLAALQHISSRLTGKNLFPTPDSLFLSPYLNLIRGVPALYPDEGSFLQTVNRPYAWAGALTYDGACSSPSDSSISCPEIFVTFGTVCYDRQLYLQFLRSVATLPWHFTIASLHVSIDAILEEEKIRAVNITGVSYIPNNQALRTARVIIHHGGVGTALSALLAGVPQLVIPLNIKTSCQEYHANNLESLKVGITLARDELTPDTLRTALERLLSADFQLHAADFATRLNSEHTVYSNCLDQTLGRFHHA